MQLNGLFWNLGGADRAALVAEAAAERRLDLIILAEPGAEQDHYSAAIAARTGSAFVCPTSITSRLLVFGRTASLGLAEAYVDDNKRITIRRMLWAEREFLLVAVHFISKLRWRDSDQYAEVQVLADEIRREEARHGHRRTILVGDLNMNPFEPGVVQANCLHAMMCKLDLRRGTRTVQKRDYPFFYNPMWGLFGDRTAGPSGSYYQRRAEHLCYDWNIFDQVLFRPEALEYFNESIQFLDLIGQHSLLTDRRRPNREVGSDHLPLLFELTAHSRVSA